ncbi:oxygen-independent coproporphyrinogen III oxidase [Opitutus sp. ER46]|uniref:oxygen-independent coproporphyrinogen III oxidase n=1 Tax=Opitutus sp. ER46 TaxID=2161864 RepID=UPI000D310EE7|nr:oxygen-independent coproporphyrinogen III oxidase [Opitutus sp. ER46]PTX95730.1 oxygen-independent coproporphyrinogen III oxidase [Opitutus sp. ER46]
MISAHDSTAPGPPPAAPTPAGPAAPAGARSALDLDLIRKYSIPGPRYTSYPPATQFTTDLPSLGLDEAMAEDNRPGSGPLSLYFHLPFCETRCWFCGCNTVITRRRDSAGEYLQDLAREMRLTATRIDSSRPVAQIHLGGGTPTFFPPDELRRLGALIRNFFLNISPDVEFGVEVDPRRLTTEHVMALREIGANRASLGVQDTNPRVQLAIHRHQPHRLNEQTMSWLRSVGFSSINVDLIFGLPLQTADTFARTVDDVLALNPDRLSVFSYAHVPWIKPAQKIFEDRDQLPSAEEKLAMFAVAHEKLTAAGYIDIGLDHFAKPDDELAVALREGTLHRNFQGYSTRGGASLYSFGISSISSTEDTYRQNFKSLTDWRAALDAGQLPTERGLRLTAEDKRRRHIIMRLMCDRRLNFANLSRQLGLDFAGTYAREIASLDDLVADGLVTRTADGIEVTHVGVPLLRVVAMRFDATLSGGPRKHSRTI